MKETVKLQELFTTNGDRRPYCLTEDGIEIFFYKDRNGYTVRQALTQDAEDWFEEIESYEPEYNFSSPVKIMLAKAKFASEAEKMLKEDSGKIRMLIYNPEGKMIAVATFEQVENCEAAMELCFRDEKSIELKSERVMNVIKRMYETTKIYDEIFMIGWDKKRYYLTK